MATIPFVKMHGIGNDFVVVSADAIAGLKPEKLATVLCDRHFGVGSDGLLIIGKAEAPASFSFRMHNPDGSPDMCGNGLRCAVLYAHHLGLVPLSEDMLAVETIDGLLQGHLSSLSPDGKSAVARVEMAVPRLSPKEIPYIGPTNKSVLIDLRIATEAGDIAVTCVNTGSTHSVAFVDELPDDKTFFSISPLIENHPYFPERTSLMWAKQTGEAAFSIRIWERAAGETLGCGTGACAVAVAAIVKGLAKYGDRIEVTSKGGTLSIEWSSPDSPVWLTGPAKWVYAGEFEIGD